MSNNFYLSINNKGGEHAMARKKSIPMVEESRKELSDGRYNKPLDVRIQERRINASLKTLRALTYRW
jgi:hypothetical protein